MLFRSVETINGNTAKGYGEHYIPVQFEAENLKKNTFYNVLIKGIDLDKEGLLNGILA